MLAVARFCTHTDRGSWNIRFWSKMSSAIDRTEGDDGQNLQNYAHNTHTSSFSWESCRNHVLEHKNWISHRIEHCGGRFFVSLCISKRFVHRLPALVIVAIEVSKQLASFSSPDAHRQMFYISAAMNPIFKCVSLPLHVGFTSKTCSFSTRAL